MPTGFIGTGHMGNPMARRLIGAGHQLVVHDLNEAAAANLIELGAQWAGSPREVAERCELIFLSLPGPPEVRQVVLGEDGVLPAARPGTVIFDLSSNAPETVRDLARRASERDVTFLDSPVSGGTVGAERGTLAVMVGGDRAAFEAHRGALEAIGGNVFHLGDSGAGAIVKLMNNMLILSFNCLLDEALVVGQKAGIDPETLHSVLSVSSSAPVLSPMPRLFDRRFDEPTFTLALASKDINLAVQAGTELGVPMPVASAAGQVFQWAKGNGLGGKSPQGVLLQYERAAGVEIRRKEPTGG
ncbi:MAG TPA: NAD(P)-dependent oxidoreductase [Dehalococcoidia bacterium]|jgi:3-hydroxyisobutyrate dehydrogenase-like beta-hydroxyacid dehydrogenase|nr:NAD(P)-dependent oxidoreductase [Dehalococcoidia bacterium]